ncbi:hypothetical protein [Sphingobacterium anhuiense]|uniref:hypothetical protein n=1 Tax=Sphingobacterium anhuiense TaxID=493780 RepID=UPI003C2B9D49
MKKEKIVKSGKGEESPVTILEQGGPISVTLVFKSGAVVQLKNVTYKEVSWTSGTVKDPMANGILFERNGSPAMLSFNETGQYHEYYQGSGTPKPPVSNAYFAPNILLDAIIFD